MWSPSLGRMHSHMVPSTFRSALRYGPFRFLEWSPIWSFLLFEVHSHKVRNNCWSVLPLGPHHIKKCSPNWSSPIEVIQYDCFIRFLKHFLAPCTYSKAFIISINNPESPTKTRIRDILKLKRSPKLFPNTVQIF